MIIVFEGFDKSGKTTIKNTLNKITNFEHVLIDRGPRSSMFFDDVIRDNFGMYLEHEEEAARFERAVDLIIYCMCDKQVAIERLKEANEEEPVYFETYDCAQEIYLDIISKSDCPVLYIYTDEKNPIDCAKTISDFVRNNYKEIKIKRLRRM